MANSVANGNGRLGTGWRIAVWGMAVFLLLLPAVAMRFTREVNWDETDFMTIGAMLLAACCAVELGARMSRNPAYRAAVGVAVVTAFLLIWINLAMGIIGTEDNPANLMFAGVLAVGTIGAIAARARPAGMALTLVGMAIAQMLVGVSALAMGYGFTLIINAFFAALWLTSAWLFKRAASEGRCSLASFPLPGGEDREACSRAS